MKVLLIGDYSNVHATLGAALKRMGHEVCVASDGDGWKNYPRDVDLRRPSLGRLATLAYLLRLERAFLRFRGFDVVQLIGPDFLPLKAERLYRYYRLLRRHNRRVFLGAFGMDKYWVKAGTDCATFRYSDFNLGASARHSAENDRFIADWLHGEKGRLNDFIARDCDGIVSGLYEYDASYRPYFADKLKFIPFPIDTAKSRPQTIATAAPSQVRFFIGVMSGRSAYKGTDVMLRALRRMEARYGEAVGVTLVESVPFDEYRRLLAGSHVLLDQLYSYTPAMNALEAMAQGLVVVGGGEPENYAILGEEELRPIVNVAPTEESVFEALCNLVERREEIPRLQRESREYVVRHHDADRVARAYVDFWCSQGC
ncbi:MAG: glycosyltransferase family 4 protein [Bacteroidaceae bacterium]|nr:glycosyltransferase family 4 protein [Bacteroidaceae bacterium]